MKIILTFLTLISIACAQSTRSFTVDVVDDSLNIDLVALDELPTAGLEVGATAYAKGLTEIGVNPSSHKWTGTEWVKFSGNISKLINEDYQLTSEDRGATIILNSQVQLSVPRNVDFGSVEIVSKVDGASVFFDVGISSPERVINLKKGEGLRVHYEESGTVTNAKKELIQWEDVSGVVGYWNAEDIQNGELRDRKNQILMTPAVEYDNFVRLADKDGEGVYARLNDMGRTFDGDFTITVRMKASANFGVSQSQPLFGLAGNSGIFIGENAFQFRFIGGAAKSAFLEPDPNLTEWNTFRMQRTGADIQVFQNDVLVGSTSEVGVTDGSMQFSQVARWANANMSTARIDVDFVEFTSDGTTERVDFTSQTNPATATEFTTSLGNTVELRRNEGANASQNPQLELSELVINNGITEGELNFDEVIVEFSDKINSDFLYDGNSPRTLNLTNSDFNNANQVFINYRTNTDFEIVAFNAPLNGIPLTAINSFDDDFAPTVDVILHGGQSNGAGEGTTVGTILDNSQALLGYQNYTNETNPATVLDFEFDTKANFLSRNERVNNNANAWYGEAFARGGYEHATALFAQGGTPTFFFMPRFGGNGGRIFEAMNACLSNTVAEMQNRFPDHEVNFPFIYWDQVEFVTGNGVNQDITYDRFIQIRNNRANVIAFLYDSLAGNNPEGGNFDVTNPNVKLFIRDVSDGQWRIGGGGVALNADLNHPDYIIKGDASRTFSGTEVPYNQNPVDGTYYSATAEWNGWMATRAAHQLLTDPSHGSEFYRPNIILVNADGIGTRGDEAISGDGVHFGAKQKDVAKRFLEVYNPTFGTNFTINEN